MRKSTQNKRTQRDLNPSKVNRLMSPRHPPSPTCTPLPLNVNLSVRIPSIKILYLRFHFRIKPPSCLSVQTTKMQFFTILQTKTGSSEVKVESVVISSTIEMFSPVLSWAQD